MPGGGPGGWHIVREGESSRDGISDDEEGVKGLVYLVGLVRTGDMSRGFHMFGAQQQWVMFFQEQEHQLCVFRWIQLDLPTVHMGQKGIVFSAYSLSC